MLVGTGARARARAVAVVGIGQMQAAPGRSGWGRAPCAAAMGQAQSIGKLDLAQRLYFAHPDLDGLEDVLRFFPALLFYYFKINLKRGRR